MFAKNCLHLKNGEYLYTFKKTQSPFSGKKMELIFNSERLTSLFKKNLKWCNSLFFATAWASKIDGLFEILLENREKIKLGIVGLHFYQTHPDFIKEFIGDEKVKFIMQTSGTFHPKIYLFEKGDQWSLIVGSANFTNAAFSINSEICVEITNDDNTKNDPIIIKVLNMLLSYKKKADTFDTKDYEKYKATWEHQKAKIKQLAGTYGKGRNGSTNGESQPLFLYDLSWDEFYARVLKENRKEKGRFERRVELLKAVKKIFNRYSKGIFVPFSDYTPDERKLIAGIKVDMLGSDGEILEWGAFGSMDRALDFKDYINDDYYDISDALECIPREGNVDKSHYDQYVKKIKNLYGINLGTASRLLAMKCPDTFVCVDKENCEGLSEFLQIPNIMNKKKDVIFDVYWEDVICQIREFRWWYQEKPAESMEAFVWENRAAFFDSLFYRR